MTGELVTLRAAFSFVAVIVLLTAFIWALKRGSLRLSRFAPRGPIAVETAMSLGERRSLAIVGVEGRRLLVGLTPTTISLVAELGTGGARWPATPDLKVGPTYDGGDR
jgi:flagellar biogenesis protein FliO